MRKLLKSILSLCLSVTMAVQVAPEVFVKSAESPPDGGSGSSSAPQVKVSLNNGKNIPEDKVSEVRMPSGDSVDEGTKVGDLTAPELDGYVFDGWYYDEACTEYAYPNDEIKEDKPLYASFTDRLITGDESDLSGNYVASMDLKDKNFRFRVTTIPPMPDEKNIPLVLDTEEETIPSGTVMPNYSPEDIQKMIVLRDQYANVEISSDVTKLDDNTFEITAQDGFEPGKVYQLDISGARGIYIVYDGETKSKSVIYHNMSLYREEVVNMELEDGIIYIPASDVENLGELKPLMTADSVDLGEVPEGMTALQEAVAKGAKDSLVTQKDSDVSKTGSFVYKASRDKLPKVGDTVCIYKGTSPKEKQKNADNLLDSDEGSYMVIDRVENSYTFYYHLADPMDVVDVPVVVPIKMDADTEPNDGNRLTLSADAFTFDSNKKLPFKMDFEEITYGSMKLDEKTKVEAGDYIAVYEVTDGNVSEEAMSSPKILRITDISTKENADSKEQLLVSYTYSSDEELQSEMQVHAKDEYDVPQSFIDDHKTEVERLAHVEFDKADKTPLLMGALTDEKVTKVLAKNDIDLSKTLVFDGNDQLINADMLDLDAMDLDFSSDKKFLDSAKKEDKVKAELKYLTFKPEFYRDLEHFKRSGVGFTAELRGQVEVSINKFTVKKSLGGDDDNKGDDGNKDKKDDDDGREGQGKIVIDFTLSVTQEIFIDQNIDFDIEWKWYIIPVDLRANISIDVGSWSNIKGDLRVSTGYEDDKIDWKEIEMSDDMILYEDTIKKINDEILPKLKDAKEAAEWDQDTSQGDYIPWEADDKSIVEHIIGDDDDDPVPTAATLSDFEKAYKNIVDGISDSWMPLVKVELLEAKVNFEYIVEFKLEIGFTLSICGTIEIGVEFNYDYVRRYSASFALRKGEVSTSTTDIQNPHSTFSLYAIGIFGLKPAVYVEMSVGLISTDLDSISVMAEAGFELVLYLYGYLNIDNWRKESVQFQGGIFFDVRFTLDISLGAQVGKGLFSTSKTIYDLTIPLISLGTRYQIRGFAEDTGKVDKDDNPLYDVKDTMEETLTLETINGYSVDIPKETRLIFALDMRSGDVVPYIPEADDFTYEVIGDNKPYVSTDKDKMGRGVIKGFASNGEKYEAAKIFLDNTEQDFDKVKSYEQILLDYDQNKEMAKFNVDVKMTYKIPGGVLVRGKTYSKILHITVDQSALAKFMAFQKEFYTTPDHTSLYEDERVDSIYYMPKVPIANEFLPDIREKPTIVGYTFKGWQPFKRGSEEYRIGKWVIEEEKLPDGSSFQHSKWEERIAFRGLWVTADDDYTASAIVPGEKGKTLENHIQFEMIAEPKPQKLKVRHYLLNAEGTKYELVGENDAFECEGIVSDAEYDFNQLKKWKVLDSLCDADNAKVERKWSNSIASIKVTKADRSTFTLTEKNGVKATVTPADDNIAHDTLDVYYTKRKEYNIIYQAVDESGKEIVINGLNVEFTDRAENDSVFSLYDKENINKYLEGFEFDGWYDITAFDSLSSKENDKQGTKRMPANNITVKFKAKPVEMYVKVVFNCNKNDDNISLGSFTPLGGETFTLGNLLNEKDENNYFGNDRSFKEMMTNDRNFVTPTTETYTAGGLRSWENHTFTVLVSESNLKPDDLKIRVVFTESNEEKIQDGEEYIYASLDFGTTGDCGDRIRISDEDLGAEENHPAGYWFEGFVCGADSGPYVSNNLPDNYYRIPVFMYSHLTNSEWTEYDESSHTLTYYYRTLLRPKTQKYIIKHVDDEELNHHSDDEEGLGYSGQVIDMFPQHYYVTPGYEPDYEKTPETFTIKEEGDTVVTYYLKKTNYNYDFTIKDPGTGEVLFTETLTQGANTSFELPEELTLKNEKLNLKGYRFLGWAQTGGSEWIEQNYYKSGTPYQSPLRMTAVASNAGSYEAVFTKVDVNITLNWDNFNCLKIKDGQYKSKLCGYDSAKGYSDGTATATIKAHTDFTLPEPTMYDGSAFLGWYDNPDFSGEPVTGTQQIDENTVYYARIIQAFPVTFVGNADLTDPCDYNKTVMQTYGNRYVLPPYEPKRTQYKFMGWSTKPNGEVLPATAKASNEFDTLYAVWEGEEYTISFDLDGGSWNVTEPLKHTYNESTTSIPEETPTKTGYRFIGWQRSGSKEVKQAADITFRPKDLRWSTTFYAVWEPISYLITYDAQGGTMPDDAVDSWSYENQTAITAVPSKPDAAFRGWYEKENPGVDDVRVRKLDSTHAAGNVTLYAKWNYNEYFINACRYSSDGKYINPVESDDIPDTYKVTDNDLTLPDLPDDDVWEFDHWEVVGEDGIATTVTKLVFADYSGKINLHAVFNKIVYSITYDLNGGSHGAGTYPESASIGETVRIPVPTRDNYHFAGWEYNEFGKVSNSFEMKDKSNITLKATWKTENGYSSENEAKYKVMYYIPDNSGEWTLAHQGDERTTYDPSLAYSTIGGEYIFDTGLYQFEKVKLEGNDKEYGYYDEITVSTAKTNIFSVYYSYRKYNVHFMMEHGSVEEYKTQTLHYNDKITKPETDPVKEYYVFNGWDFTFNEDSTVEKTFAEKYDYYIYPKDWTLITYPVTYVGWPEGDNNPNPECFTADTSDFELFLPVKKGYTAKEQTVEVRGKKEPVTVTIEWEKNQYDISYDLQGGKVTGTLLSTYDIDTAQQDLPVPVKEGYTFEGWTIGDSTEKVTSVPRKDVMVSYKLKANWKPLTYKIYYDLNDGTPIYGSVENLISEYSYDDVLKGGFHELNSLEKEGYSFDGWDVYMLNKDEHLHVGNAGKLFLPQPGDDLYITAEFSLKNCKISYDLNDKDNPSYPASNPNSAEYIDPSDDERVTIAAPYRTGYEFEGWTCSQKLGDTAAGTLMKSVTIDSSNAVPVIELKANWKAKPYYISYKLNGGTLETTSKINTSRNEFGELVPDTGAVKNPMVYSIYNTIDLDTPTRTDGISFLGWTSDQFYDLLTFTECELSAEDKNAVYLHQPVSTEGVISLLNAVPLANFAPHYENLREAGIILKAEWADKDYPIYYNLNGGNLSGTDTNPESYTNQTETFTVKNPVRTGYVFLGWRVNGSEEPVKEYTVKKGSCGEIDLEAVWSVSKFTVTYELYGGKLTDPDKVTTEYTEDDATISLGNAYRNNSNLLSWNVLNADTKEVLNSSANVNSALEVPRENPCNMLVTANWNSQKGSAYADPNGGEWAAGTDNQGPYIQYPLDTGATVLLSDPVRTGYTFKGWENCSDFDIKFEKAEEGSHNIIIPAETDSRGIQLKALWEANDVDYTVNWYVKKPVDEEFTQTTKNYTGKAWEEISDEQFESFKEVIEDAKLIGITVNDTTISEDDPIIIDGEVKTEISLYFERNIHTVEFEYGQNYGYALGEKINEPASPERKGYIFDGWFKDPSFNEGFGFENALMVTEDIKVYSRWIPNTQNIEYVGWPEEIENPNPHTYIPGSDDFYVKYPKLDPNATGYDYGTMTDDDVAKCSPVNTYAGTDTIIVTTPWQLHNFSITYEYPEDYGCEFIGTQVKEYNFKNGAKLPTLSANGHTFIRWDAKTMNGSLTLEDNSIPTGTKGDVTLTAVFYTESYTISYSGLENSSFAENNPNPVSFTSDDTPITLENPTKDGYTFNGWADEYGSVSNPFTIENTITDDLSLTATWMANEYIITVNETIERHYDIEMTMGDGYVLTPPEEDGKIFDHWIVKDESDNEISIGEDNKLPAGTFGNLTATAVYNEISYNITYDFNGGSPITDGNYPETYKPFESIAITDPELDGYSFDGWNVSSDAIDTPYMLFDSLDDSCGDVTLTAQWSYVGYPDHNVVLLDVNYKAFISGKFDPNTTVTKEMLEELIPDGYEYDDIVDDWDDTIEEFTVEEYMQYSFRVVKAKADIKTVSTDGTNTDIAQIYCQETAFIDSEVTAVADDSDDYTFDGWYSDDTFTNCLCSDMYYTFTVTENPTILYAKYTEKLKATVNVSATNDGKYTVNNGSEEKNSSVETITVGNNLTLTATDTDHFLKWVDENGKTLGMGTSLDIEVMHDMTVVLVYSKDASTYVEFYGPDDQVIVSNTYKSGDHLDGYPVLPAKLGYDFRFWSVDNTTAVTTEEIEALFGKQTSVAVYAVYEKNSKTNSITVFVDNAEDTLLSNNAVPAGTNFELNAPEVTGKTFMYWSLKEDGSSVYSYDPTCSVKSVSDVNIYAVYCDENSMIPIEPKPAINVLTVISENVGEESNEQHKVAIAVARNVPYDYEIVECGILYFKDGSEGTEDNMTVESQNVMRFAGTNKMNKGTLTLHVDMTDNETTNVYARGYIIVNSYSEGMKTIYTDVVSGKYNAEGV